MAACLGNNTNLGITISFSMAYYNYWDCCLYLQIIFFGDCILTRKQFEVKKRSITFYYYILVKFGFKPNMYHVRFFADYIMPWIILGIALLWQISLNNQPQIY